MSGRRSGSALPGAIESGIPDSSQTLVKGLNVLRAFRAGDQYLGNKDIAERTGLTRPTVSRLAGTLVQLGCLRYSEALGKYSLGTAVLALAYPMLAGLSIRQIARPLMKELADAINGHVSMGMASGCAMVYIESSRSPRHRHTLPEAGSTISMLATSMGRAYLTALSPPAREALLAKLCDEQPADWQAHNKKVAQAVQDILKLGFTRSMGDARPEIHACAVPLRTRIDGDIVVVNCGVPAYRLKAGELEQSIGPHLLAVARQIDCAMTNSLGYRAA
jgi:DNA-binding IclR family transcriptional regulator